MTRELKKRAGHKKDVTIEITKYANRRLYDTCTAQYTTFEEVVSLIREGHTVEVREKLTGKNITNRVLLDCIAGMSTLPISTDQLYEFIRVRE